MPKLLTLTGVLEANMRTDLVGQRAGARRPDVRRARRPRESGAAPRAARRARGGRSRRPRRSRTRRASAETAQEPRAPTASATRSSSSAGAITQQEYDKQTTSCATQSASEEAARARAAEAAQTLNDSAIRAPFAGVVGERFVSVGDYVHADTRVVTLLVDDPLRLQLTVPEPSIGFVKEGSSSRSRR